MRGIHMLDDSVSGCGGTAATGEDDTECSLEGDDSGCIERCGGDFEGSC